MNRIEASAGLQPGTLRPGTPASLHATAPPQPQAATSRASRLHPSTPHPQASTPQPAAPPSPVFPAEGSEELPLGFPDISVIFNDQAAVGAEFLLAKLAFKDAADLFFRIAPAFLQAAHADGRVRVDVPQLIHHRFITAFDEKRRLQEEVVDLSFAPLLLHLL